MTIKELHIGIDLGIQRLNSNVFGKLLPEEKDYYINTVTQEFVKLALTDEKNTLFTPATYANIREYYERLQSYIRTTQLGKVDKLGYGYVYGTLPSSITIASQTTGVLYDGVTYKVVVAGATDLSAFGYKVTPVVNETFECNITTQTGASISIVSGEKYRIINAHGGDFTTAGALNNNPGTEFTATSTGAIAGGASTVVQNLSDTPAWDGTTELIPVNDIGYYMNITTRSTVKYGNVITSGTLTVGNKYVVTVAGTTDFSGVGGVATPDVGYIFTCTSSAAITWQGGTQIYQVVDRGNRLVKAQDVDEFLEHSFGSVISSPISIYADNKLRVYHDNKFTIERMFIDYIRKPISVSLSNSIDSDLPESVQPFLVDLVIERILAHIGSPTYAAVNNENKDLQ